MQEWVATHRDKKAAYSADVKRKEGIRDAVQPAVAAYEEAKKALKEASAARRAAMRGARDPPASVRFLTLAVCLCIICVGNEYKLGEVTWACKSVCTSPYLNGCGKVPMRVET